MRVVAPRGSKIGYFFRNGILCSADIIDRKLDLETAQTFDFFDDNTDWQEAMNALEILEKFDREDEQDETE